MSLLSKNHLIIEVHDCLIQDKYETSDTVAANQFEPDLEKRKLYELVTQTHDVEVVWCRGNRSGSQFTFLRTWPDYDRAYSYQKGVPRWGVGGTFPQKIKNFESCPPIHFCNQRFRRRLNASNENFSQAFSLIFLRHSFLARTRYELIVSGVLYSVMNPVTPFSIISEIPPL